MAPESLLQSIFSRSSIEKRYFLIKMRVTTTGSYSEARVVSSKTSDLMDEWLKSKINILYRFDNIYKNLKKKSDEETLFFIKKPLI